MRQNDTSGNPSVYSTMLDKPAHTGHHHANRKGQIRQYGRYLLLIFETIENIDTFICIF